MHAHRTDGRCSPGATDPGCNPRVQALGIADALRVHLDPRQLPWLLDEVDELRIALESARGPELRRKRPVAARSCPGTSTMTSASCPGCAGKSSPAWSVAKRRRSGRRRR